MRFKLGIGPFLRIVTRMVRSIFGVGLAFGLAVACGPPNDASSPNGSHSLPPDKTEVTMQGSPYEGPSVPPPSQPGTGDLAAPPPTASAAQTTSPPSTSGGSSDDEARIGGPQAPAVEAAVAPIRPRIRACYKKAQAADSNVNGTAMFDATIGKDGKVVSARPVKREGLSEEMVDCLLTAVKTMKFQDSKQKSQIVPFTFGSGASSSSSSPSAAADAGAAPHK